MNINRVELASQLAAKELNQNYVDNPEDFPNGIINEYTIEGQEAFDSLYDVYWDIIEKCKE